MRYEKGFKLALATVVFSGVAVFLNSLVVKAVGDALVFTTVKNLGVAIIIGVVLGARSFKRQIDWKRISKKDWLRLLMIGVIGGSLPFYLFFKGLMLASPVQAALIHKTLIFWVALYAVPFLKERISAWQWLALLGIFGSNFLIGGLPSFGGWGVGETMILGATILWSIENIIAKAVLKRVEADVVVGARMILGSIILLLAVAGSGKLGLVMRLNGAQWLMTLASVGLLSGYVMSWYRALKLAPVTMVATVLCLATVITNGLTAVFITHSLNTELIYQAILLVIFSAIFVREARKDARIVAVRQV